MPNPTAGSSIVQVQIDDKLKDQLDMISKRSHVPKSVIMRMGVEAIINEILAGKVTLGFNFGPPSAGGNQPPPPGAPSFTVVQDPKAGNQ